MCEIELACSIQRDDLRKRTADTHILVPSAGAGALAQERIPLSRACTLLLIVNVCELVQQR